MTGAWSGATGEASPCSSAARRRRRARWRRTENPVCVTPTTAAASRGPGPPRQQATAPLGRARIVGSAPHRGEHRLRRSARPARPFATGDREVCSASGSSAAGSRAHAEQPPTTTAAAREGSAPPSARRWQTSPRRCRRRPAPALDGGHTRVRPRSAHERSPPGGRCRSARSGHVLPTTRMADRCRFLTANAKSVNRRLAQCSGMTPDDVTVCGAATYLVRDETLGVVRAGRIVDCGCRVTWHGVRLGSASSLFRRGREGCVQGGGCRSSPLPVFWW